MSSPIELAYPPSAHVASSESPSTALPVRTQPSAVPAMSPVPGKASEHRGPAQRIRGGCIPCPDGSICYIIPIPCICC
ncbi:hypothetical protein FKP32DRAFT_1598647 [Trametes sanguinea]|nr:hypothetical protein FKP32DRAFT_1598647 [Trametes sanguinea]